MKNALYYVIFESLVSFLETYKTLEISLQLPDHCRHFRSFVNTLGHSGSLCKSLECSRNFIETLVSFIEDIEHLGNFVDTWENSENL